MPIPKPKHGESQKDYIERGMSNSIMKKEFPDHKQRLAVLFSTYREHKKKQKNDSVTKHSMDNEYYSSEIYKMLALEDLLNKPAGPFSGPVPLSIRGSQAAILNIVGNSPLIFSMLIRPAIYSFIHGKYKR